MFIIIEIKTCDKIPSIKKIQVAHSFSESASKMSSMITAYAKEHGYEFETSGDYIGYLIENGWILEEETSEECYVFSFQDNDANNPYVMHYEIKEI